MSIRDKRLAGDGPLPESSQSIKVITSYLSTQMITSQFTMAIATPNIYTSVRPLELFLKFNGFIPLWNEHPTLLQRTLSIAFFLFNIAICLLVTRSFYDAYEPPIAHQDLNDSLGRIFYTGAVTAAVPLFSMIFGFSTNKQFRRVLGELNACDYKVSHNLMYEFYRIPNQFYYFSSVC